MKALTLCAALLAGAASAQQSAVAPAENAARQLEAAAEALADARGGRDRVRALTNVVQAYETGLIAMRDGLRDAALAEGQMRARFYARSTELSQLLAVLQSMGRAPGPVLFLHPSGPLGTARGGMLVADLTPELDAEVSALRADLQDLADLRTLQESARTQLADGLRGAQEARAALSAAIADRTDLPQRFDADPAQTALLIAATETLDAFATGLADSVGSAEPLEQGALLKGALPLPVQGTVLRRFDAPDAAGITRPGWIIATQPRALVTTPSAATVLFSGPLLDYGTVTILEPAPDVMMILAGLAEVYGSPGQVLPAGDPVGLMGGSSPDSDGILMERDASGAGPATQTLYLEVRDGQSPVDPADWFALQ